MKTVEEIKEAVSRYAPGHPIRRVSLFGSYARGEATEESDVDLLVEYSRQPSLLNTLGFEEELGQELGVPVDVVESPVDMSQAYFRSFKVGGTVSLYG